MDLRLSSCTLVVHDVDEALGFYRDLLGFDVHEDGGRVSVSPPSRPYPRIVLDPSGGPAVDELVADGLLGRLVLATDDCDATFEHLEAAGVEVIQEPIDQPCGVRDCAFRDPSGTTVRFVQER